MRGDDLVKAVASYPVDAEWNLLDDMGPHVVFVESCGCVISWSFWTDDVVPKVARCDGTCLAWIGEEHFGCHRCGHDCQPKRNPTPEEAEIYGC